MRATITLHPAEPQAVKYRDLPIGARFTLHERSEVYVKVATADGPRMMAEDSKYVTSRASTEDDWDVYPADQKPDEVPYGHIGRGGHFMHGGKLYMNRGGQSFNILAGTWHTFCDKTPVTPVEISIG